MDYVDFFYSQCVGIYPNNEIKIRITEDTIDYLKDNKLSSNKIIEALKSSNCQDCLYPENLPDELWNDSLIRRNRFYYHKQLQLVSKAPALDILTGKIITYPFYKEIIINFTMKDLIDYFYTAMDISKELIDIKKDSGSFNYLFKKYSAIKDIETLDLILVMIDITKQNHRVTNIINIEEYNSEAINTLRSWQKEARIADANKIIWRSSRWLED